MLYNFTSSRQGPLHCVHGRWEAVRGPLAVPWHNGLW
uniref:Uncharacterized protein n=1 Tax=Arundo donax TaxID=35708 RepID=A0A0A8YWB9_ARUDO